MITAFLSLTLVGFAPLEASYLVKLRGARNAAQLQSIHHDYKSLRFHHKLCQMQLRQRLIPWGCYRMVHLELAWKLVDGAATRRLSEMLDTICQEASQSRLRSGEAVELDHRMELSARCRGTVEKAAAISSYRSRDDGKEFEPTTGRERRSE